MKNLTAADVVSITTHLDKKPVVRNFFEKLINSKIHERHQFRIKHAYRLQTIDEGELWCINARLKADWRTKNGSYIFVLFIRNCGSIDTSRSYSINSTDFFQESKFFGPKRIQVEDQRCFQFKDEWFLIFNAKSFRRNRRLFLHRISNRKTSQLRPENMYLNRKEKNWTPLVRDGRLLFVYSFNPVIVFECTDLSTGACKIIKAERDPTLGPIEMKYPWGGTQLLPWRPPNFVGFVHSRHPWRAAPLLFDADRLEVVGIGEPIELPIPKEAIPPLRTDRSVQYPYHLKLHENRCKLWVEYEDLCPATVEINYEAFRQTINDLVPR